MRKSIPAGEIARAILVLRGNRVLLNAELAALYAASTSRSSAMPRFPADFIFRLTPTETAALNRSQNATGTQKPPIPKRLPIGFTADLRDNV